MEQCLLPARVGILPFIVNMIKVLLPVCTLTWPVNNYVSRQGKGTNRRNESTNISIIIIVLIHTFVTQLTLFE